MCLGLTDLVDSTFLPEICKLSMVRIKVARLNLLFGGPLKVKLHDLNSHEKILPDIFKEAIGKIGILKGPMFWQCQTGLTYFVC